MTDVVEAPEVADVEWFDQPRLVRIGADGPLALLVGTDHGDPVVIDLGTPRIVAGSSPDPANPKGAAIPHVQAV